MRFLNHINHMRGIAIVPVVVIHCISIFRWPHGSTIDVCAPLFRNVNILFIFVSGFLFAHLSASIDYRGFLKRRFSNVILPYLVISIPAILVYLTDLKKHPHLPTQLMHLGPVKLSLFFIFTGTHLGPLWFIPMMAILYVVSFPLLRLVDSRAILLVLPAWFLLSEAVGRPADNIGPLHLAFYFAPVYLLGMLCARHEPRIGPLLVRQAGPIAAAGLLATIASVLLPIHGLPAPQLLLKTAMCLAVYVLLLALPNRRIPALDLLARNAFAIFFIHGYLVAMGRMLGGPPDHLIDGTAPQLAAAIVVVMAVSLASALAVRWALGRRSRLILGS